MLWSIMMDSKKSINQSNYSTLSSLDDGPSLYCYGPNRRTARPQALAASTSRFLGEAVVTNLPIRLVDAREISSTA